MEIGRRKLIKDGYIYVFKKWFTGDVSKTSAK